MKSQQIELRRKFLYNFFELHLHSFAEWRKGEKIRSLNYQVLQKVRHAAAQGFHFKIKNSKKNWKTSFFWKVYVRLTFPTEVVVK